MYVLLLSSDTPWVTSLSEPSYESLSLSSLRFNSTMVYSLRAFVLSALTLSVLPALGFDNSRSDNVRPRSIFTRVFSY